MLTEKEYVQKSLELNLFFGRIMKEHMIFMEASLSVRNSNLILEADQLKRSFEEILWEAIALSDEVISKEVVDSNELVTNYTLDAEKITEKLTGICINKDITLAELELKSNPNCKYPASLERYVFELNNRIINLMMDVIKFKEYVLEGVLNCSIHIALYPLLLEHLIEEAKLYLKYLIDLQEKMKPRNTILEQEAFWDDIMGEHAEFIRGFLDPTEKELLDITNKFAILFEELEQKTKEATKEDIPVITEENLKAAKEIKDFKTTGTEGLVDCKIRSIIIPLLGDHVLREANHYIRLLKSFKKVK